MGGLIERLLIAATLSVFVFTSCVSCVTHYHRTTHTTISQPERQITKYHSSVAMVTTTPGDNWDGKTVYLATAWAIDEDHLLTAGHFCDRVAGLAELEVAGDDVELIASDMRGLPFSLGNAEIVDYTFEGMDDICLIKQENHTLNPLTISTNYDLVETEDPVIIVGAPGGHSPVRREGFVWSAGDDSLTLALDVQPGCSGSAVIWNDEVIGLVVQTVGNLHAGGRAVTSVDLLKFISKHIK